MEIRKRPIKRVLIANRGEIAVRIIRACREMDIRVVSVFSDVDRKSLHALMADEAYPLSGSTPAQSYLNQDKILHLARATKADAIHPGYGFLAENPSFARRVEEEGIKFIGPRSESIAMMGDKTEARRTARNLGIPTVSGTEDPIRDERDGLRSASDIGFPILLKAAAGGGGKGMRIVRSSEEFSSSFRAAQSEAKTAFGDERVYIEKYLDAPRHIEVQILADSYGNTIYLGERECSIQRRHQKVIEESPSPAVDEKLRRILGEAAVALAKAARYENAGTMEFLVDQQHNFHFLEMNTRLQVEHPVTEATTGVDLVKEQIQVAEGRELGLSQSDVRPRGHAIECRICAEDPQNDFLPSTGLLVRYQPPEGKIRVENGFRQGDEISVYYDSLLSKVISWGATRDEAIASMKRALSEFAIEGVKSTIPFCQFVLDHPAFRTGDFDTRFVERHFKSATEEDRPEERRAAAILAVLLAHHHQRLASFRESDGSPKAVSQWKLLRREAFRS